MDEIVIKSSKECLLLLGIIKECRSMDGWCIKECLVLCQYIMLVD
jgi:hypothetical protein